MLSFVVFFFNDTATTEIYTLSLQRRSSDLPRCGWPQRPDRETSLAGPGRHHALRRRRRAAPGAPRFAGSRSEEHTSELQSRSDLVCRLLLEKKKNVQ